MKRILYILLIFISAGLSAQQHYRVKSLKDINTDADEIAPMIYKNGIVFSSNKKSSVLVSAYNLDGSYPYNLYFSEKKGRKWSRPSIFSQSLTSRTNEMAAAFSSDENTLFITRNHMAESSLSTLQKLDSIKLGIFECKFGGSDWVVSEDFYFNDTEYMVGYPSISPDGNLMFFASRAPGGYGGYDIYVSEKRGVSWSDPENLGPSINTAENEVFPFYHENGRLYFSSRGHNTIGNLDIFYSEKRNGNWITPINLPRPFNSRQNDFGYVLSAKMDTGYFASNRRGSDDIYLFASAFPAFSDCPFQQEEDYCFYFEETGSMDLDTTSLKYEWDFGDGNKVRNIQAEHCYEDVGFYMVSLNVIDTLTGEVYFSEATYDLLIEKLEQPYITSVDTVRVNERFDLDGNLSVIRSFEPKDYFWDFGDGNIETGIEATHTYTSPGEYYIRLGITDGESEEDSDEFKLDGRKCAQKMIRVME
jgi:hypothetical protein